MAEFSGLTKFGSTPSGATFPTIYGVLQEKGQQITDAIRKSIIDKKLIATRKLLQGLNFQVRIFGNDYKLTIDFSNDADAERYASAVETGRPPGKQPPIEPIMKWIRAKGIPVDLSKRTKKTLRSLKHKKVKKGLKQISVEKKARQLAFGIAFRIGKFGTIRRFGWSGSKFWSEVVNEETLASLKADLQKALKRDVLVQVRSFTKPI